MKALFGSSKKKATLAPVNAQNSISRLKDQSDNLDKRIKVLENNVKDLKNEAVAKKRGKDQRGAIHALKQAKMKEKEVAKLDGMKILMDQQVMMIESSIFDKDVMSGLSEGQKAVEQLSKQTDVEQFEDLRDKIEDQMADMKEKQEFFEGIGQEDQDDLLDELDYLEAEMVEEDMQKMNVPMEKVKGPAGPSSAPVAAAAAPIEDDEARELEALMS